MIHFLLVAIGGGIGAALRHFVNMTTLRMFGPGFPWGTITVNIVGSFVMGLAVVVIARATGATNEVRLFLMTGLLGGFTTFSAFSLDFANMWERGQMAMSFGYAAASVVLSVAGLFAGLALARALT